MLTLVIGGARSGKSAWAEHLALASGLPVTYVATAQDYPDDPEWQRRIDRHQQRRPKGWQVCLLPRELAEFLEQFPAQQVVLIDSLGTWVANWLEQDEQAWQTTVDQLLQSLAQCPSLVILVVEETGWGVIPSFVSGRVFRDRLGELTQQLGAIAQILYLVIAGYALRLDCLGQKLPTPSQFLQDSINY